MIKSRVNTEWASVRLGIIFSHIGLSPNSWTLLSIVPSVAGFILLVKGNLLASLVCFLVAGLLDAVDGAVARVTGAVTKYGGFLDGIVDRYVEILLYLGLGFNLAGQETPFMPLYAWLVLLVFGATMTSYVRAYADHRRVVTDAEDHKKMGGLFERGERMTLIYLGLFAGAFDPRYIVYSIVAAAVLSNFTVLQRIVYVRKKAGGSV
ncbi:Archaetidylinositol phosphate synthase [uncultured archaeon]|nr:Archaetidylinositol phosphate synthase [uncultured archaeon]